MTKMRWARVPRRLSERDAEAARWPVKASGSVPQKRGVPFVKTQGKSQADDAFAAVRERQRTV